MRRIPVLRAVLAAVCLLLLGACGQQAPSGPQQAPELSGQDLQGNVRDIADLRGQVVLVNAWASWCAPCREEMPVLAEAQEALGAAGLQVLGLNVRDRPDAAQQLVEETGVNFPSVVDDSGTIAVGWGISGMPQTFLVNREGDIVARQFGAVEQEWIDSTLAPLVHGVEQPSVDPPDGEQP